MTVDQTHADQVAADDAHLRSLGIRPQLNRTLGLFSSFAVAFSYISVATGSFTQQAVAIGVGDRRSSGPGCWSSSARRSWP